MRREGLAALVAILVVASLGIGYLSGTSTRATETMTSVSTSTVTSTATSVSTETSVFTHGILVPTSSASTLNPLTGLSLDLNLSTNANGQVVVTAYEFNTLDRVNNVSLADSWPTNTTYLFQWFRWAQYSDYCTLGDYLAGYEVLQGNYELNNFTSGTSVWLQPFAGLSGCGELECPTPTYYTFAPLSEADAVSGTFVGSWTGPPLYNGTPAYSPFASGSYTVVASDEWGQVAILHFIVAG